MGTAAILANNMQQCLEVKRKNIKSTQVMESKATVSALTQAGQLLRKCSAYYFLIRETDINHKYPSV